jgi:diadenosine tetraphosphate (Ap4A) HIT family hydrolase
VAPCVSCRQNALAATLPLRECLYEGGGWRVAHGWSSLPGWLVIVADRHVESLAALTADEAASLGSLLRAASGALEAVVACERTYVMLFAELAGHRHLHFHVVPRMSWFGESERGPAAFRFLNLPEEEQVPVAERERLAAAIRDEIAQRL